MIDNFENMGLLYYVMEVYPGGGQTLENLIKSEIEDCNIFVLIVQNSLGNVKIGNETATQFEFEYAKSLNKRNSAKVTLRGK